MFVSTLISIFFFLFEMIAELDFIMQKYIDYIKHNKIHYYYNKIQNESINMYKKRQQIN